MQFVHVGILVLHRLQIDEELKSSSCQAPPRANPSKWSPALAGAAAGMGPARRGQAARLQGQISQKLAGSKTDTQAEPSLNPRLLRSLADPRPSGLALGGRGPLPVSLSADAQALLTVRLRSGFPAAKKFEHCNLKTLVAAGGRPVLNSATC